MKGTEKPVAERRGRVWLRGSTWWCDFGHRGERVRRPLPGARTEKQAWDAMELLRTEARQGRKLDVEYAKWPELRRRFEAHHEAKGTKPVTLRRWTEALTHLEAYFGSARVEDIAGNVTAYIATRRRKGAKPATIRLEVAVLAQAFRVSGLPRLDAPRIEVHNVKRDFFEPDEVALVIEHLPPWLRPVVWFAFYTGWRKESCLSLEWKDVDFERGVARLAPGVKRNDRGARFPFASCPPLARVLLEQRERASALERELRAVVRWVFFRPDGDRVRDLDDAWRSATRAAGLPGRTFHGLRRSAVLWMRRAGLSESDIMEAVGLKTRSMFQRYAIEDESGLAARVARAWNGTKTAQGAR